MQRVLFLASIGLAFAAGSVTTRLLPQANAAAETITPQLVHVGELAADSLGMASGTGMRSKNFVSADGMTLAIQAGNALKHQHPNTNEFQYILEGSGTRWLGDKEVKVKAGDLLIIPKGTTHGGTKSDGAPLKAIAIKTPPQGPDDTKPVN
ncbi:MAG: hypothetical protein QOD74_1575 [Variibacter sp.]|jgi:mannose-6-phosphate isomerase-like protein (cupin superfamily)|nr:hypothetical protein [Variibacter sp.]